MTDRTRPARTSKRQAVLGVLALALAALGTGLVLETTPQIDDPDPPGTTPDPAETGTLLADDALNLAAALDEVNTAMDGYPDYLYWFQVDDLGVTFFDSHLLSWYTVTEDSSAFTACVASVQTGDWVLYDSAAADITGTGTTPDGQPSPDCVAADEEAPSGKTLASRSTVIDVASVGDLVASYHGDTKTFPKRGELVQVTKDLLAPGNRLDGYTTTKTSYRLCVTNTRYDASATYDSAAADPVTTHNKKCEPRA